MAVWGYARVSTLDQDPQLQVMALYRGGVDDEHLVIEHASGAKVDRPKLADLLGRLEPGDVLTVWKLDRLGRSLSHLVQVVEDLSKRDVQFRSITESLDTTTPSGRLLFHLVGAVAEFERDLTRERTLAAVAAARQNGTMLGRRSLIEEEVYRQVHILHKGGATQEAIAKQTKLPRRTVRRIINDEIPSLVAKYGPGESVELRNGEMLLLPTRQRAPRGGGPESPGAA